MNSISPKMVASAPGAPGVAATSPSYSASKSLASRIDPRFIAPILITLILLVGQVTTHILEDYRKTALAIVVSIATELTLGRLFTGKWPHLASAYVSGISVGILLRSPDFWPYALCAAISIASKYVIRVNGRHLWNPSNLGIVCMLLLAPNFVATLGIQWDNNLWAMLVIWTVGSIIVYRLKRFHICATYVSCFLLYAGLRALLSHDPAPLMARFNQEVAPITGPMYQLFIFFMITDPKTTVHSRAGQMLVAFLIATSECLFRMYGMFVSPAAGSLGELVSSHAPYFALTVMGPSANLIEILRGKANKDRLPARQEVS